MLFSFFFLDDSLEWSKEIVILGFSDHQTIEVFSFVFHYLNNI